MRASKRMALALLSVALLVAPTIGRADTYIGGATAVYKEAGQSPAVDKGVTICHPSEGTGIGAVQIFTSRSPTDSPSNGSLPVTHLYAMTPSDQTSVR